MSQPKNVILLVADSLRYDSVHRNGDIRLPYINKNAYQFSQARSSGCWTLPATASLFTGLLPHQHGATSQTRAIHENIPTLAEKMKAAGYKTYQITANVATTHIFGLHRGFDEVHRVWDWVSPRFNRLQQTLVLIGKPRLRKKLLSKDAVVSKLSEDLRASMTWLQYTHEDILNKGRKIIAENEAKGEKTFLFLNMMESHFPYHVAPTFETTSEGWGNKVREVAGLFHMVNQSFLTTTKPTVKLNILQQLRTRQRKSWEILAPKIDGFVQEMHQDKENLMVFCSDHGDNFGDQGWQYHFSNVTDGGNKVPIFILPQGNKTRQIIDHKVNAKDIHSTLLHESGVDTSALSLIKEPTRSQSVMQSYWYNNRDKTLPEYKYNQFAFVNGSQRYVNRKGAWYQAPVSEFGNEPIFSSIKDKNINPIQEIADIDRRHALQTAFDEFLEFSKKVLP